MIALDTNILVRHLMRDDPAQNALVNALMTELSLENPGFISREVVVELIWVLEVSYRLTRRQIADALEALLGSQELVLEADNALIECIEAYATGGPGLADRLIRAAAVAAGCDRLVTFDRKLGRMPGVTLLA